MRRQVCRSVVPRAGMWWCGDLMVVCAAPPVAGSVMGRAVVRLYR